MILPIILVVAEPAQHAPAPSTQGVTGIEQVSPPDHAVSAHQLSRREPTVPVASPAPRRTYVAPVGGEDRCSTVKQPKPVVCRDPIEARADEFTPTDPTPLSPEQRAAVGRRLLEARPVAEASRAARIGKIDDATPMGQSLVATAQQTGLIADATPEPSPTSDLERAIAAGVILPSDTGTGQNGR